MATVEGESVQTNTNSQPKNLSSQQRRWNKNAEIVLKLTANEWWPFDRVDGKLLEKLHREKIKQQHQQQEVALL